MTFSGAQKTLGEAGKLFLLSRFLFRQVRNARRGDKSAQMLLTELYLWGLSAEGNLRAAEVRELVPEVGRTSVTLPLTALPYFAGSYVDRECLLSTTEINVLTALVNSLQPKRVLEFGTFRGGTTFLLANNLPESEIFTLDLNLKNVRHPEIKKTLKKKNIHTLTGDSKTFDYSVFKHKFDLIFIDGGHDEATVRSDTANALRLIAPGGLILWHDYQKPDYPGVTKGVDDFSKELEIVHLRGTSFAAFRLSKK